MLKKYSTIVMRKFLAHWYYFWGHLISKPMHYFDLGCLYIYCHKWMSKSIDYDVEGKVWKEPKHDKANSKA